MATADGKKPKEEEDEVTVVKFWELLTLLPYTVLKYYKRDGLDQ